MSNERDLYCSICGRAVSMMGHSAADPCPGKPADDAPFAGSLVARKNAKAKDGGSAFPWLDPACGFQDKGASLRDLFAAAALIGLLTRESWHDGNPPGPYSSDCGGALQNTAWEWADAMLNSPRRKPQ